MLRRQLSLLKQRGVTVNSLIPGPTESERGARTGQTNLLTEKRIEQPFRKRPWQSLRSLARDYITTGAGRPRSRTCPSDRSRRGVRGARAHVRPVGRCACLEVVEVRRGEARARSVDLEACRLKFQGESERDRVEGRLRRAVTDAEH